MKKALIFAGTTEGRLLAERFAREKMPCVVCVATAYGEEVLSQGAYVRVHTGRLDTPGMQEFLKKEHPAVVVDATHPYAREATANIRAACEKSGCPYVRVLREPSEQKLAGCIYFDSADSAARYLEEQEGTVFLTTGSKELCNFTQEFTDVSRIVVRILPSVENIALCREQGLVGRQLICMQGPFSTQLNEAMLRHCGARWLVTKESGNTGGFLEKYEAARRCKIPCIVIKRPEETGASLEKIWEQIQAIVLQP